MKRAISSYQQSLVVNPNQLAPQLHIFVLQMKLKRFDDARATLDTAAKSYPTAPVIPFYYGIYHTERKDYAKAVTHFVDAESLALDAKRQHPARQHVLLPLRRRLRTHRRHCERQSNSSANRSN